MESINRLEKIILRAKLSDRVRVKILDQLTNVREDLVHTQAEHAKALEHVEDQRVLIEGLEHRQAELEEECEYFRDRAAKEGT